MRGRCLISMALLACLLDGRAQDAAPLSALMPRAEDYTSMWWVDGFPGRVEGAPWQRCVQTGSYAMVLDTEAMKIPHFGPVATGAGYAECNRGEVPAWKELPAAELGLEIRVGGKSYRGTEGGKWSRWAGPRLVESGRFFQRADVTDLVFRSKDGERLNVEARFETAAWPDRLGMILAARPGMKAIVAGEGSFGKVGGGFGLDGTNHLEIPHSPEIDPEQFTLELWAFVPTDHQASERAAPWLVCKNSHESRDGNYGLVITRGVPQARLNIGGGRDNQFVAETTEGRSLKLEAWNHLAMSYDGDTLRIYLNGALTGEQKVGRKRVPGPTGLAFGRRQDNSGDGHHFRGVVDEIRLYDHALTASEVRQRFSGREPAKDMASLVLERSFKPDGVASPGKLSEQWKDAAMEVSLRGAKGELRQTWKLPVGQTWSSPDWNEVHLSLHPAGFQAAAATCPVAVKATELATGATRPVEFSASRGWHRVNLDGIEPILPEGGPDQNNDAMERIKLVLSNPSAQEQTARLMFEKDRGGIRHRTGAAITGIFAMLRDAEGKPTGIPVQLSKNWHNEAEGGVYIGPWFHGISQVRLPAASTVELELCIIYGHWGGVAAASHAQLSLIGWGSNQRWDQSAVGSWGESICYEPDQAQAQCSILDVRPLMVSGMKTGAHWNWTNNVGGGDYFRLFDPGGKRVPHAAMRAAYQRYGPCLTEVTYSGRIGRGIEHSVTASLGRTDDLVRGVYQIRLNVKEVTDFSRFAVFQVGADSYNYTSERKMAFGNEGGLIKEWSAQWGGDAYRTEPAECTGRVPWISLHDAAPRFRKGDAGAWANRGLVIRSWKARLGGKTAAPWVAERGVSARGADTSVIDILPPPGVTRLEPGDYVEATIEYIVMPQFAKDYYGPNKELRAALAESENTWRMIHREALGNDRRVEMEGGTLEHLYPDVRIRTGNQKAGIKLTGGLGYVPVTFTELPSSAGYTLAMDGKPVNQSTHGNDFWQTNYDPATKCWSRTYNVPVTEGKTHALELIP